jgi:hypothetical protein
MHDFPAFNCRAMREAEEQKFGRLTTEGRSVFHRVYIISRRRLVNNDRPERHWIRAEVEQPKQ